MIRILLLALLVLAGSGCATRTPEPGVLAWWIEDHVHGLPRRIEELQSSTPPPAALLDFLAGDDVDGQRSPPRLIQRRSARLPVLREALRDGHLLLQDGELLPAPGLRGPARRAAEDLADAENLDRRQIDVLVLRLGAFGEDATMRYRDAIHAARAQYDREAGGRPWTPTP